MPVWLESSQWRMEYIVLGENSIYLRCPPVTLKLGQGYENLISSYTCQNDISMQV